MTPERWQQINAVVDAVLEQPPDQRFIYLNEHYWDDPTLCGEVLSLLEAYDQAEHFLEEPAKAYAAPLIPTSDDLAEDLVGQSIDGFRLLSVLGRGGMGIVYKAEDEALSRTVALKMIDPAMARDEAFVRRFRREARALARIDNRHIVSIHAMRQTTVGFFIVMEYVDGGTVTDLLAGGPLSWLRALPIITQTLTALDHAHSLRVIHRDIKPGNIMVTGPGVVKVTDFGLAKVSQSSNATTVTQGIAGTLYYMSPEQVLGASDLDHRSDLYSMGMTIYKMLTGRLPMDSVAGEFAIMQAIVESDWPAPSMFSPHLSPSIDATIMKALEKDPDLRYQSAAEMRAAFDALQPVSDSKAVAVSSEADTATLSLTAYKPERAARSRPARQNLSIAFRIATGTLGVVTLALVVYLLWPKTSPSQLSLTTIPDQATVLLNGDSIGTTPISQYPLDATMKRIHLSIKKSDYALAETTLTVIAGMPLSLRFMLETIGVAEDTTETPTHALLRVMSSPGNARVLINGKNHGPTDASGLLEGLEVEPGDVTVRVTSRGYQDWERRYPVAAGQTLVVSATLAPIVPEELKDIVSHEPQEEARGSLTVSVEPQGTIGVQDEDCQAGVPCAVWTGTHGVTCSRDGYEIKHMVEVQAGGQQSLTCYTEHKVTVQVRTEEGDPIWATILVNGDNEGQFPDKIFRLGPGDHRIEVRRNEFEILRPPQTILVRPAFEEKQDLLVFQIRRQ